MTDVALPRFRPKSSVDVLREYFGDLPSPADLDLLSLEEIQAIGILLVANAEMGLVDSVPGETYYPGGWLASGWNYPTFGPELTQYLLYYPRLLVHDPLDSFFFNDFSSLPETHPIRYDVGYPPQTVMMTTGPQTFAHSGSFEHLKSHKDAAKETFKHIVLNVCGMAPLIDSQVLILRSQWPTLLARKEPLLTSLRHDVSSEVMQKAASTAASMDPPTTRWDNLRGAKVSLKNSKVRAVDRRYIHQDEFLYMAKSLAVADQAQATYVPPTDADHALLAAKASTAIAAKLRVRMHPADVLKEVHRILAPSFELDMKTTIQVRKDEESFDDWRRSLRTLARDAAGDDAETLAERVEDTLVPRMRNINQATKKSTVLGDNLLADGTAIAISAGIGASLGGPLGAAGGAALAAAPGVIGWLAKAYQPRNLSGRDVVLARIMKSTR